MRGESLVRHCVFSYTDSEQCSARRLEALAGASTYQEEPHSRYHAPYIILLCEDQEVAVLTITNQVPEVRQRIQKVTDREMIVGFAVVRGQPSAGSGGQQSPVSPAVGVHRVHEDDVALVDGNGDGGFIGRRRDG